MVDGVGARRHDCAVRSKIDSTEVLRYGTSEYFTASTFSWQLLYSNYVSDSHSLPSSTSRPSGDQFVNPPSVTTRNRHHHLQHPYSTYQVPTYAIVNLAHLLPPTLVRELVRELFMLSSISLPAKHIYGIEYPHH